MNEKQLAELLNGKTENAITESIEKQAKKNGLVIVYGASDDLMEFSGAIHDESSCYSGGEVLFTKSGCLQNQDECEEAIETLKENGYNVDSLKIQINKINALWCPDNTAYENLSWAYETEIPHEKFEIMEDGEVYCIGIVFSLSNCK
jgi:hypothetical protein